VHEFPLKDLPFPEDLGGKASEFVIEGFLIGDEYISDMKRLIAALKTAGPGTLVHPSLGTMQVSLVQPGRLREQFIERRGMVSFSLAFVEAGDVSQPSTDIDTQQAVDDAADAAYGSMGDDFASMFSIDGAPAWSVQSIIDEIGYAASVVSSVRSAIHFDLAALSQLISAGAMFKANVTGLLATPNSLFTELSVQFRALINLFDFSVAQGSSISPSGSLQSLSNFGSPTQPSNPLRKLLPLGQYGQAGTPYARPELPTNTPVRRQQAANQTALCSAVARCAVVEAVRSSIYLPFSSADESTAIRADLYDALDQLMLDATDPVYAALHDLRSAMVQDITARGADLARLSKLTLSASVPAQVLSYRLYGTGAYAPELVARNQVLATVMHPLFLPGGTELEVRRAV